MNAEKVQALSELEGLVREGLQDALDAGHRSQEAHFYRKLALIAGAKGQYEEGEKYLRWAADLEAADGLTPDERRESDIAMTELLIGMAKTQGDKNAEKAFRGELKRLKKSK